MNEHQQPLERQEPSMLPTGQSQRLGQSEVTARPLEEPPREEAPREDAPRAEAPRAEAPGEEPPREEPPREEALGEEALREDALREEAPRENVSPVRALLVRVRDTCRKPLQRAMQVRTTTVIRLSDDARSKVDTLIAAGVFETRGETTAFLIDEGIHARESLFRDVEQKLREIDSLHSELRNTHHSHG